LKQKLRVLLTGATGFVGSHLIPLFDPSKYDVYGTSFPQKPLRSQKNIIFLDIRLDEQVDATIQKIRPDWIFHLAAVSNVRHSWQERKETLETNLLGTFSLFEAARKFVPECRILFISSSDIYGIHSPSEKKLGEDDSYHIVNPYAFTKASGELLSKFYAQVENLNIIIARPFPHTGPGQGTDFVCADWAFQIARIERGLAEPVIKVGNIEVRRDFMDVRDVVRAYFFLVQKGKRGEVYNVCSGRAVSLKHILELLLSFSLRKISIETDPEKIRKMDIPLLVGNNEKLKALTSWKPKIPLEKTLGDLLDYWREKVE
jgi:GDP-4-dehydro-6-deoxy-D-mannose reductase